MTTLTLGTATIKTLVYIRDADGMSLLHLATDPAFAAMLIAEGIPVDLKNKAGRTPLHYAVWRGRVAIATLLVEAGAEWVTERVNGHTPLHQACFNINHRMVAYLLTHDEDINAMGADGWTPLHLACARGATAAVELLLAAGCTTAVSGGIAARALTKDPAIIALFAKYA